MLCDGGLEVVNTKGDTLSKSLPNTLKRHSLTKEWNFVRPFKKQTLIKYGLEGQVPWLERTWGAAVFWECSVSVKMLAIHPVGESETRKLLSTLAL